MNFSTWILLVAVFKLSNALDLDVFEGSIIANINNRCNGSQLCDPDDCQYTQPFQSADIPFTKCDCHVKCLDYGTCCVNFEEVCLGDSFSANYQDNEGLEDLRVLSRNRYDSQGDLDQFFAARKARILVEKVYDETDAYFMYVKCPECTGSHCDAAAAAKCQSERAAEWEQLIPVVSNGTLYRNIYCYQCNNPTKSKDHAQSIHVDIGCHVSNASAAFDIYENYDIYRMLDVINSKQCMLTHRYISDIIRPTVDVISSCSYPGVKPSNFSSMEIACASYSAYFTTIKKSFKNPHCALCNKYDIDHEEAITQSCICGYGHDSACVSAHGNNRNMYRDIVPFFRIALNFNGKPSVEVKQMKVCDLEKQELVALTMNCENRICPKGYFKQDSTCLHLDHLQIFSIDNHDQRSLKICATFSSNVTQRQAEFADKFSEVYHNDIQNMEVLYFYWSLGCEHVNQPAGSSITLQPFVDFMRYSFVFFRTFESPEEIMSNISTSFDIESLEISANEGLECPKDFKRDTVDGYLVWTSTDRKGSNSSEFYSDLEGSTMLYIPKHNIHVYPRGQWWKVLVSRAGGGWKLDVSIELCFKVDSMCDTSGSSSANFLCDTTRSLTHSRPVHREEEEVDWMVWEVVLNLLCAVLSIICLISTLIVQCLFPGIMKTGGRAFIPLLISLLAAEFCMLFSGLKVWAPAVCSFLAAFQHFGWLSSFTWTAVLSWDIFSHLVIRRTESSKAPWLPYFVIGWGIPLLIVGTCSVLHLFGYFQYGDGMMCWILHNVHLGVAFGLPVAFVITFNMTLYFVTLVTLSRQMDAAERANRTYDMKVRFVLYVKLSSIVGFTWLFGFLANIEALSFLKYVFSVCAGLNGVFVSLSFTLSGRSIQTFRDALSRVSLTRSTHLPSTSDMQRTEQNTVEKQQSLDPRNTSC